MKSLRVSDFLDHHPHCHLLLHTRMALCCSRLAYIHWDAVQGVTTTEVLRPVRDQTTYATGDSDNHDAVPLIACRWHWMAVVSSWRWRGRQSKHIRIKKWHRPRNDEHARREVLQCNIMQEEGAGCCGWVGGTDWVHGKQSSNIAPKPTTATTFHYHHRIMSWLPWSPLSSDSAPINYDLRKKRYHDYYRFVISSYN